jgi:hypothetical protein
MARGLRAASIGIVLVAAVLLGGDGRAQDAARVDPLVEQVDSPVDIVVAPAEQDPATPPPAPSTLLVRALAGLTALLVSFMGVAGALTALALWLGMKPLRALLVAHGATWFLTMGTPNNGSFGVAAAGHFVIACLSMALLYRWARRRWQRKQQEASA